MFYAPKPLLRSACLIAAAAASFVTLSSGFAQQRSDRPEVAQAGQPASSPALNPRHPETYVVKRGDTLWVVARALKPTGDVTPTMRRLIELNGGPSLEVGQVVVLPG